MVRRSRFSSANVEYLAPIWSVGDGGRRVIDGDWGEERFVEVRQGWVFALEEENRSKDFLLTR
jgi:hypothetical protein